MKSKDEMFKGKKLSRKELMATFWRAFLLPACYSMDRMQAPGFAYSMIPVLKKLYPNKEDLGKALTRQSEVYNTTYAMSPFILGITASMEEEASSNPNFLVSTINNIKVALMGPLAGIGDTFFWGTFRVIAAGVGTTLALKGNILGPILFLILYNIPHLLTRYYGLFLGYDLGSKAIDSLSSGGGFQRATKAASVMGLTVVGGMIASMVNIKFDFVFKSGRTTLDLQKIVDQICPDILPLAVTFFMYWLLQKKKVKTSWIMIGCFVFGILFKYLGIFK
ncbi:PTS system, mannose-specific IID component [Ligilactobacillus pobuzihii E100301 = KCTC 13174]|uniref:PTS system, mannose-specific IID component n=2 Tax=Ligilactobacillus pobuzihii TaxID=449659 RepID=A0A0R2LIS2_9LACO|nr:PTS system, mannose-specific IID component [Ligilactobacillus pobuzihii E100301 = KCTC 13174]KRO01303.1 PTS system, mannose-specific IID component [Ligilactobacillus pobuzihii]GEN48890.1 PTS mannose transporter subunit IID [Ligilactobacillus pobuzihii]